MTPRLKVTDKLYLDWDERCITLYQKCIVKFHDKSGKPNKNAGEVYYTPVAYYPNWTSAYYGLIDREIQLCETITEIKNTIVSLEIEVMNSISELDKIYKETQKEI